MVEFLIGKGAKLNLQDNEGKTALLWASSNSLENAKFLIANGAKVNESAIDGMTPFLQSTLGVSSGKVPLEMCELLRKNGANIHAELRRQSALNGQPYITHLQMGMRNWLNISLSMVQM